MEKQIKLTNKHTINVVFGDGEKTAIAKISLRKLKDLIIEDAFEIITTPKCNCSSCAVNGFCECDQINEDIEARRYCLDREQLEFILNKALNFAICRKDLVKANSNAIAEWVAEFIKSC